MQGVSRAGGGLGIGASAALSPPTLADLGKIARDPVDFTRRVLRIDPWDTPVEILRAIATEPRVAVKACHASSKTHSAASAALWWAGRYRDGIVVTTAPTFTQVEKLLWGEIHQAIEGSCIQWPAPTRTELRLGPTNYLIGISTDRGVRFQGFHGGHILVIIDEAPGVRPDIWEAIEGARAGGDVRVLALGNPTVPGGPFYDAFGSQRTGWRTFTISAFDTPNFDGVDLARLLAMDEDELDTNVRPYLVTRRWVREKYYEWGPTHPLWESRVLGQFPTEADDALLSLAAIERATRIPVEDDGLVDVEVGIDVAGPGEDETAAVATNQGRVLAEQAWADKDSRGAVVRFLQPYQAQHRLRAVRVDRVGIGEYFCTHLRDLGFPVVPVNVGEAPRDADKFRNLKAELYWGLRQRFVDGDMAGPLSEACIAQLASIKIKYNARGQLEIESKEDARKRGVKSPDRAEALMLACAPFGTGAVTASEQPRRPPVRTGRRMPR